MLKDTKNGRKSLMEILDVAKEEFITIQETDPMDLQHHMDGLNVLRCCLKVIR